ncbi:MAG: SH3 domain-containing protein [Ardenticatenales bacterium]|nr:SH3 domain-containing protein [Ardenticatenales bacterium]
MSEVRRTRRWGAARASRVLTGTPGFGLLAVAAAVLVAWSPAGGGRVAAMTPVMPTPGAPSAVDLVAAGDALYAADDLAAAADAYTDARELGGLDAAHAVRLGNAFVRLGLPGRAMAAYRLAEAATPRDPALRANIAWLRAQLANGAAAAPADARGAAAEGAGAVTAGTDDLPEVDHATAFAPAKRRSWSIAWWAVASRAWWSLDGLAVFVLAAWWVAVLALWTGRVETRRWARVVAGCALGAALLAGALLGARMVRRAAAVPAIVVEPRSAAVRQGPGLPFSAVRSLPEGAEVRYVERRGRWLRLADEGGGAGGGGWIAAGSVVDVPE